MNHRRHIDWTMHPCALADDFDPGLAGTTLTAEEQSLLETLKLEREMAIIMKGKHSFDATGGTPPVVGKTYEYATRTLLESIFGEVAVGQRG